MAHPLVSVVMSFHNARQSLSRALRSLLWQTYPHWELILLDDGSNDGVDRVLKQFTDERIRLYRDSVCRGLPVRLNQGVSFAQGQYIARLDADDVAFPERFARQIEYLEAHPEVDLLATAALLVDGQDRPMGVLSAGMTHEAICRRPWQGFSMPHPTWMGRIEWFRRHPYDERARKAQDHSLLYKTYQNSHFAGLGEVLLGYRYAGLSVRKTLVGRYHYLRAVMAGANRAQMIACLAVHTVAALRDLGCMAMGFESRVIKSRVKPCESHILSRWGELQQRLPGVLQEGE